MGRSGYRMWYLYSLHNCARAVQAWTRPQRTSESGERHRPEGVASKTRRQRQWPEHEEAGVEKGAGKDSMNSSSPSWA